MRIKTSELSNRALDWAVAKCEGLTLHNDALLDGYVKHGWWVSGHYVDPNIWIPLAQLDYSTDWAQGGPIIEREGILLRAIRRNGHKIDGMWLAMFDGDNTGTMVQWVKREDWPRHYYKGPTPLIVAMRCYVASKLGNEVDVPEELI